MATGGEVPFTLAKPDGAGPWPGLVVIHDAFGVTGNTLRHAGWLASAGFLAIVPDLYHRGGRLACAREAFRAISRRSGQAFDDIEAARTVLAAHPDCSGRIGAIGFCMGGGFALLAAADQRFDASSVNYGVVPGDAGDFLSAACPIVASFGGRDRGLKGMAQRLETALTDNHIDHDVVEYPDANHCFLDQFGGFGGWIMGKIGFGYHPVEASDARARIVRFFAEHLNDRAAI